MPQTEQWNFRLPKELSEQLDVLQKQLDFETRTDLMNQLMKEIVEAKKRGFKNIEFERPQEPKQPKQPQVCEYASPVSQQKNGVAYAYCDNPHKPNLPKDRLIPNLACQNCFERRKKLHSERMIALKAIAQKIRDYYCDFIGEIGNPNAKRPQDKFTHPPFLSELPCIKDPNLDCFSELLKKEVREFNQHNREYYGKEKEALTIEDIERNYGACPLYKNKEWRLLFAKKSQSLSNL